MARRRAPAQGHGDDGGPGTEDGEPRADISQLIVAASADGIVVVDGRGIIRLCNPAAEAMFARPARELIGTQFGFPVLAGRTAEVALMLPGGGERVAEMRVTASTLEGERLNVVALRDVTGRKQAERSLEAALEHQHIVIAVAAHELHNPLAAIIMLTQVLADQQAAMTATERALIIDHILERTIGLQLLVRKLLTASRIETAGVRTIPERVPVIDVIVEQLPDIEKRSEQVQVSCDPGLAALTDRAEFTMMIANYLENALAYGRPPIEIKAAERDGWAEIRVADHGPGVPESFVPQLFERFTREPSTERLVEGSGLGLWIVRSYAQANGGEAWYEPGEREGSCFCLRLPVAPAPAAEYAPRRTG